ncbi:IS630 family transposase [Conchiformibius steedae]|uniref:IS630 family transposase n=1 Tax=Conchiformibius steedae TaxID=153493 RepID=A0A3P2A6G0_9NEIS|nr:IS630 family transposase [Conchiformibius steedae]RRD89233.1 IS630 family transposase [Conchiformibius steedae]
MAYSTDLREKALHYYGQCNNISQTANVYGVSGYTLYRWIRLKEQTGSLKHQVKGQNAAKLDMPKLARYVEQHPDAYLYEIAREFDCTASAVLYALRRLGITRKKRPATYKEQDPKKVKHYLQQLAKLTRRSDYQTVYLDETGFDACLPRPYGRCPKGRVLKAKISGKGYRRLSLVAAQTGKRLIAPMTYQNTMTAALFEAWFERCLLPALSRKSVIILDNARFHRMKVLQEMAKPSGHIILPLAPYSPELNPIEKTWANIKRHLRGVLPDFNCFTDALVSYCYFN